MRADQAKRVAELFALGAAVKSDVEAAQDAARVARHNRDQAQVALKSAESQNVASTAELERAELELERLQSVNPEDATALERGRVELAVAQTRPAPVTVSSLFDGIVMEVGAIDGAQVESGRVVATLATRNDIWVEAYVPPNQARSVRAGAKAEVYLPGELDPIEGTIAADSGSAIRVPEILRDKLPRMMMGIYTRVNFTPPEGMPIVPGARVRVVIPK
jgi:HlyD family secretion protein